MTPTHIQALRSISESTRERVAVVTYKSGDFKVSHKSVWDLASARIPHEGKVK